MTLAKAEAQQKKRQEAMEKNIPFMSSFSSPSDSSISSATSFLTGGSSYGGAGLSASVGVPVGDGSHTDALIRDAEVAILKNNEEKSITDQVHGIIQDSIIDFNVAPADEDLINLTAPPAYEELVIGGDSVVPFTTGSEDIVVGSTVPVPAYREETITFDSPSTRTPAGSESVINISAPMGPTGSEKVIDVTAPSGGAEDLIFVDEQTK